MVRCIFPPRVGALPQFPTNEMKYNLTWSTDGLINEYGNACQAIHRGKAIEVLPLEGLEHFSLELLRTRPGWDEQVFRITADQVQEGRTRLQLSGRYASFYYWFFQ